MKETREISGEFNSKIIEHLFEQMTKASTLLSLFLFYLYNLLEERNFVVKGCASFGKGGYPIYFTILMIVIFSFLCAKHFFVHN